MQVIDELCTVTRQMAPGRSLLATIAQLLLQNVCHNEKQFLDDRL